MNLLSMLRKLGDRLGILELSRDPDANSPPIKVRTRAVTLSELIMTVQVTGIQKLAEAPSELSISFDDVYKTAGISSSPAWSVDRVIQFLENDRFRGKSRNEIQHELLAALAAEKVDVAGVIKEAISCDQALDAFAESIRKKRERWVAAKRAEIQQLERSLAEEEKDWKDWRERKRKREKDMALAVGYLIDKPVISIDDDAPAF